uniref:Zinc finger, C2H2 type n=1 Tax=Syphacia muris TaxID=451379 RepID=A0A0N5AVE8_9BILA
MEECRVTRIHECQQCGKRFKARGGLQQHLRIHSNDRPYQCHYCIKKFTQKSHVDQHERIHTGAKPFPCQFCGRAFRQRSQQMGHEATHNSATTGNGMVAQNAVSSLLALSQSGSMPIQPTHTLADVIASRGRHV